MVRYDMYNVQYRRPDAWEDPPEDIPYRREERYDLSFDDWEQQVHTDEMYYDMLSDYEKLLNRRY